VEVPHHIRGELEKYAPTLWKELAYKAQSWTEFARKRLQKEVRGFPKTFNDPVWGDIVLYPWETLLLDCLLLQRLRGVRQLGMAHLVYPGAGHDRLEHSRGVVEAAERMIQSLSRNAKARRKFGKDRDETIPDVDDHDYYTIRLAALLHDIGHGAFSHATELLIASRLDNEFKQAAHVLRSCFEGVTSIAPGEIISALLVLSEPMKAIFENPNLRIPTDKLTEVPFSICGRILGSRSFLYTGYLSGVVSGPLDADKLDYMARDSHHAGLPLGLDLHRLISKLEVVTVTSEVTSNKEMRKRADASPNKKYHEIGISLSGLGAYEQMIVGRAMLYDRLYYHHKVRSAEAMVRSLIELAEQERGNQFSVGELFFDLPDDTTVFVLGGHLSHQQIQGGKERSRQLSDLIHAREVHYRAFAFAPRFISGLHTLSDQDKRDARAMQWQAVLAELADLDGCKRLASLIFDKAKKIVDTLDVIKKPSFEIYPEHIVVDLPTNKVAMRGGDILTRTEDGYVGTPNLFFDPEKWSQAYEHQKQCGFVFTHRECVPVVGLAARIVFFEKFGIVMDSGADRASKTEREMEPAWFIRAAEIGLCTSDCALAYTSETVRLLPITVNDIRPKIPDGFVSDNTDLANELKELFAVANPSGFAPKIHGIILDALEHLFYFLKVAHGSGLFVGKSNVLEKELQQELKKHFLSRAAEIVEGGEVAGGETDLVLSQLLVIENKVNRSTTAKPLDIGDYAWQARRYSIAVAANVGVEVLAYKPSDENAILPMHKSINISEATLSENRYVVIRIVVPWGHSTPHDAKKPKS
jgi:HD superfamily phosphohydrolase